MPKKAKLAAPDWTKAEKPAKVQRVKRVGWKTLQALQPGASLKDHHVVGLVRRQHS